MWRVKKPRNVKKAARGERWPVRKFMRIGGGALVCLAVFFGAIQVEWRPLAARLDRFLAPHFHLELREVRVNGARRLADSEVVTLTGLRPGMSMWKLSPRSIEERLRRHPWIRDAVARREFPHRVIIEVEERTPRAIAALNRFYYVDADGVVFEEVGNGGEADLPIISGIGAADWLARAPALRERVHEVLRASELFGQRSLPLSEIRFEGSGGVVFYPVGFRVAFHMGWGDWPAKLARLERVLAEWRGNELRLSDLDLSFRDQVVARLRQAEG